MDKKLLSELKKIIYKIIKGYNSYLVQDCDNYKNFTGRDIDAFYKSKNNYSKKKFINTIIRNKDYNHLRIHINSLKSRTFLSLDIEELSSMKSPFLDVFKTKFNKKIFCKSTKLDHLDKKSIIFYKLYKYFTVTIHSFNQLSKLKKSISKLNKKEFQMIMESLNKALPEQENIIKKFMLWDFQKFIRNKSVKKFFFDKVKERHKKRLIFSGKLNYKNVVFRKNFFKAFLFGSNSRWKKTHNPMPAIAIVGNDGSGKTTIVEYIRNNFTKMDPLIFDMKLSEPFFPIILKVINNFKKLKQIYFFKNFFLINKLLSIIAELLIIFDKYIKYKIGMAWADSGNGITIFERYPTDRVRGEFPNKKNILFPFEQFFPFPDGLVYLDVLPKDTIKRKNKDNHSIEEMISKRKNYLSLIKEFDEKEILHHSNKLNHNIKKTKNYIFKIYLKKKNAINKNKKVKRIKWNKNYKRVLAGKNLNRSQKNSFL